jgi:O-acetylserine/cysteine efflux transporter
MTQVGFDGTTWMGMLLTLIAPLSLSAGNILLRRAAVDALPLMVWLSVIAAPIFLFISFAFEGVGRDIHALEHVGWLAIAAVLYIGIAATLVGYGLWGHLLKLYPASVVAPYSLLVPVFGAVSANAVFGDQFGPMRLIGMGLILLSVAITAVRIPRRLPATTPAIPPR